ncbi:MAG: hypothetical protein LIR50_03360 [Bacillota bacterium]|nr:hypothetical protein [Bacillota bacterium]
MNKLFKIYVLGICSVILGQLLNAALSNTYQGYIESVILIVLLFIVSIKTELMGKKEFLFMQLGLLSVFLIIKLSGFIMLLDLYISFQGSTNVSFSFNLKIYLFSNLIQLFGFLISIICLAGYYKKTSKETEDISS